jgi:hypothetical protein
VPSSMIFASLVVLWLLILVPAVARHRQEVARPSVAALSGRVLARSPRRRSLEVDGMVERDETIVEAGRVVAATRTAEVQVPSARTEMRLDEVEPRAKRADDTADAMDDDAAGEAAADEAADAAGEEWAEDKPDDRLWERPPARYRAGRGGFDAEAAALAARARYAFRQRVVLAMLVLAVATGVVAGVVVPVLWWVHGAVDVVLVGYLVYLRRQVRMEEAIRARRAARMAGTRRPAAADDPELDDWAERGRAALRPAENPEGDEDDEDEADAPEPAVAEDEDDDEEDAPAEPAAPEVVEEERPALPRLRPTPPPPLPAGTALVEDEEEELDLDDGSAPGYRRAVGQ